ncbi:MAG: nucleotidyl transferase AbiEii/AbiGii toxin family protein [Thermoplasmata archaeon]|nr:nucleotidyl transferase AbiEii/AbiGii toxin family protein [Thermoplasmata archaeon]
MKYSEDLIEKTERLLDILTGIGQVPATAKRLSLCGGTALNLLRSKTPPRLSEDLDFNFRHSGRDDWGSARQETETALKSVLQRLGYDMKMLKIQPLYNQGRFYVRYRNRVGRNDLIKIEIGYMRRIPDLRRDSLVRIPDHRNTSIKTPVIEELYANKFCTMFSRMRKRPNARDVFDVATMSTRRFRHELFTDLAMVETVLMDMKYEEMRFVGLGKESERELANLAGHGLRVETLTAVAEDFSHTILEELISQGIAEFQDFFKRTGKIKLGMLNNPDLFNLRIQEHPQLQWLKMK